MGFEVNWTPIWNRTFTLIDAIGGSYYSGNRFIKTIQEFDPDFPSYGDYIEQRRREEKSTTRRDYYKDIFLGLNDGQKFTLVDSIIKENEGFDSKLCAEIRRLLGGDVIGPSASVPAYAWNSDRLNTFLNKIDGALAERDHDRAVTLSYTCLEGYLGAFLRAKVQRTIYPTEIIELSKEVAAYLKSTNKEYPEEVLNLIKHAAHAVNKARDRFSEAHFAGEAGLWLATVVLPANLDSQGLVF
jgi:hypothetical protein